MRRDVAGRARVAVLFQLVERNRRARHLPPLPDRRRSGARVPVCQYWLRVFVEPASGNEDGARAGVGKDVVDLFERLRRVDGNVDRAEAQDRQIDDRPLGPVLGKKRDAISGTDTETRQTERDVLHALDKSCRRDVVPLAVSAVDSARRLCCDASTAARIRPGTEDASLEVEDSLVQFWQKSPKPSEIRFL
jgi:hypothetical protein